MGTWPITFQDLIEARRRIRPYLDPTPLRHYPVLDAAVGEGIRVLVKHENHNPTGAFKVRNGLAAITALPPEKRRAGVVAATRGNHGLGLAWAGGIFGVPVTICVPVGNNPEKNEAVRGLGATLIEEGRDYDEALQVMRSLVEERGLWAVHSTNDPMVIAGAGTIALEILEQTNDLDAMVIAVGGGSQAVGSMTAIRALKPGVEVFGVQAERASAIHDSWRAGRPLTRDSADTFADGLATRSTYATTFEALREGLRDFVVVGEGEIAEAIRILLRSTHNLAEGAGAAGLAGLIRLRERLAGKTVGIILSGANIDSSTLTRVLNREI